MWFRTLALLAAPLCLAACGTETTFPCGADACERGIDYCQKDVECLGCQPSFSCQALPPACDGEASCGCFSTEFATCTERGDGAVEYQPWEG